MFTANNFYKPDRSRSTPYRALNYLGFEIESVSLKHVAEVAVKTALSATANRYAIYYGKRRIAWLKGSEFGILKAAKRIKSRNAHYSVAEQLEIQIHKYMKQQRVISCKVIKVDFRKGE